MSAKGDWETSFDWITGSVEELEYLLTKYNPSLYYKEGSISCTPLLDSICAKRFDLMEALLKAGADPNIKLHGNFPIVNMVRLDMPTKFIKTLIEYDADINVVDNLGRNLLNVAIDNIANNLVIYRTKEHFIREQDTYNIKLDTIKILLENDIQITSTALQTINNLADSSEHDEVNLYIENIKSIINNKVRAKNRDDRNEKARDFRQYAKARFKPNG